MGFAVTSEQIALFLNKNCQVIFIDNFFFIIKIIPYKAAFLAVFRNGLLSKDFLVLLNSIQVKYKNTARIQIIIHQGKNL